MKKGEVNWVIIGLIILLLCVGIGFVILHYIKSSTAWLGGVG
ncbi:MAG: hypothetical protein QS99_C0018G0008 [archaeon GW2011_AR4]|nr:MAG: hypothetical protein QS99_C0018G0008 [archaeon GW2011_AR4]